MLDNLENATDYLQKGNESRIRGKLNKASYYYRQAIEYHPNLFLAHHLLGITLEKQGEVDEAIACYQTAIDLNSQDPQTYCSYYRLGLLLARENYLELAIKAQQKVIQIKPDYAHAYHELAGIFAKQGKLAAAIALQTQAKQLNPEDAQINYGLITLLAREENLQQFGSYNYKIISLGFDCLPRTIPTKWGLKPTKLQQELSCPFDLAHHPYSSVCNLIKDDFQDYLNPRYLEIFTAQIHNGEAIVRNTKYNCTFSHERGCYWIENNFHNLKHRYEQRIKNFYHYLKKEDPILFIFHNRHSLYPQRLVNIITDKFPELDFKLLYIYTGENPELPTNQTDNRILSYHLPLPNRDYQWSLPKYYTLPSGIKFEQEIISVVKKSIEQHFSRHRSAQNITNFVTIGSCLSFVIGCHYRRLTGATCLSSTRHNRVDRILNTYLHKTCAELPYNCISKLEFDRNSQDLQEIIDNQFSERMLGKTCLNPQTATNLVKIAERDDLDLIIYDSFCELLFKLLIAKDNQESLFLNTNDVSNWQDYFTLESQHLSIEQIIDRYVEIVKFFQLKNPQIKVIFINFPFFHHHNPLIRSRNKQLNEYFLNHPFLTQNAFFVPAVTISPEYRKDLTHFQYYGDRNLYDDYALIVKLIMDGRFSPQQWHQFVQDKNDNLLNEIKFLYPDFSGYDRPVFSC